MLFTNPRSQASYNKNTISPQQNTIPVFPMMMSQRKLITTPTVTPPVVKPTTTTPNPAIKKMRWGESHWNLFHTMAEKVTERDFPIIRKELLDTIFSISSNLPCPICSTHATQYMNGVNFNAIQTKDQLKNFLFVFHNSVNQRKGVAQFPRDQLEGRYSKMDLNTVIAVFLHYFKDKQRGIKMASNEFFKTQLIEKLKVWFGKFINYCD